MSGVKVTCGVPTIGRTETLAATLNSIAFQHQHVDELILLDESTVPVTENYAVNQVLDMMSMFGVRVVVLRERKRSGIGSARYRICSEARNPLVFQVDDDVVVHPSCLGHLIPLVDMACAWAVPTCLLIQPGLSTGFYIDTPVDRNDHRVLEWTSKYPWFVPYFRYTTSFVEKLPMAGTQAILLKASVVLEKCQGLKLLGNLPREDTYLTSMIGPGKFSSDALCVHYEHGSQVDRGQWLDSMFYRLHLAISKSPNKFVEFLGGADAQ